MKKKFPHEVKPPRRFQVKSKEDELGFSTYTMKEVTGKTNPNYFPGLGSPWLGDSIDDIAEFAAHGFYGSSSSEIEQQALKIIKEMNNEETK